MRHFGLNVRVFASVDSTQKSSIAFIVCFFRHFPNVGILLAIKNAMESKRVTEQSQRYCEQCQAFQKGEWNTGYCHCHKMFVLQTFHCAEVTTRCDRDIEGGGSDPRSDEDEGQELRGCRDVRRVLEYQ